MTKSIRILLLIILLSFLFRGIFLVAVFPIFKGQDESRHYNTVQYLATGKGKDCQKQQEYSDQIKKDLSTYRYSDEIKVTALVTQHKQIRGEYYDKINFASSNDGYQEEWFKNEKYSKIQHICPPDVATSSLGGGGFSLYQWGMTSIEKMLGSKNIFIRYDLLRIISVLLGGATLLLAYNIFRVVEFTKKQSLILVTIISFQPKLVTYFTNINYDVLLIPLWTAFILVGAIILKKGCQPKADHPLGRNIGLVLLLVAIFFCAIMTKPSALPLLGVGAFLAGAIFYKKFKRQKINWIVLLMIILIGGGSSYLLLDKVGLTSIFAGKYLGSLGNYLSASLPKIDGSSRDYWGAIGWSKNNLTLMYVKAIWVIEWVAWFGLGLWIIGPVFIKVFKNTVSKVQWKFFRQLVIGHHEKEGMSRGSLATIVATMIRKSTDHIRQLENIAKQGDKQKRFFWFMLTAIIVLQIGIRVADWKVFTGSGSLELGTPGRYWLPNIVPHFVLLGMGLRIATGLFAEKNSKNKYFELSLLAFLVLMILYWVYEVFDIVIPRFYL